MCVCACVCVCARACVCVRACARFVKYSAFLLSLFWASLLSRYVPDDAFFLRDVSALLGVTIKERRSMTDQPVNLQIYGGSVSQEIVHLFSFDLSFGFMETIFQETTFRSTEANPLCATVSFVCVMHSALCLTRTVTSRSFTDLECPHVFMQTSFYLDFYLCKSFSEKDGKTIVKRIWNTVKCEIKVRYESNLVIGVMKLGLSHWGRNVGWGCSRIGCWGGY